MQELAFPLCCDPWQLGAFILIRRKCIGPWRKSLPSQWGRESGGGGGGGGRGRWRWRSPSSEQQAHPRVTLSSRTRPGILRGVVHLGGPFAPSLGGQRFSYLKTPRGQSWPPLHPLGTRWPFWVERLTWLPTAKWGLTSTRCHQSSGRTIFWISIVHRYSGGHSNVEQLYVEPHLNTTDRTQCYFALHRFVQVFFVTKQTEMNRNT